jgi:hypothetical protein
VLSLGFGIVNNLDVGKVIGSLHEGLRQPGKCLRHGRARLGLLQLNNGIYRRYMLGMCYIIYIILGPPIRGFGGGTPEKKIGGLFTKFLGGFPPLAV